MRRGDHLAGPSVASRSGPPRTLVYLGWAARPIFCHARALVSAPRAEVRAPLLHDEIVAPDTAIRSGRHVKQESLIEQPVSLIERLASEVELSREERASDPLHLEVIVPG